jgi:tol-pal system protein YbgF
MAKRLLYRLMILVCSLVLAGCATRREIVQFKEDVAILSGQVELLRNENGEIRKQLNHLIQSSSAHQDDIRSLRADFLAKMDELSRKSDHIESKLEDAMYKITAIQEQPGSRYLSRVSPDTVSVTGGTLQVTESPKEFYDSAYRDLKKGNYPLSLQGFTEFIRRFPDSVYAGNAQYWIGEIFYAKGEYDTAFVAFNKVVTRFPKGEKVRAALLKMGYCLLQKNDRDGACRFLNTLVEQYPNTEEAALADKRMKEIK